jgi:hypothetical protein
VAGEGRPVKPASPGEGRSFEGKDAGHRLEVSADEEGSSS